MMSDRWNFTLTGAGSAEPLARRVYREIRLAIITLSLRPGQALSEAELARQFGLSRQPVHDAFIRLHTAGLLQVRPQRATMISRISTKDVLDMRLIRKAIEGAVMQRAVRLPKPEILPLLRQNLLLQRESAERQDSHAFLELDDAFHRLVTIAADWEMAWTITEDAKSHMDRVRFLSLPEATSLETLIAQHEDIVAGIAEGNEDKACRAIDEHLGEIERSLPLLKGRFPDLFDPA